MYGIPTFISRPGAGSTGVPEQRHIAGSLHRRGLATHSVLDGLGEQSSELPCAEGVHDLEQHRVALRVASVVRAICLVEALESTLPKGVAVRRFFRFTLRIFRFTMRIFVGRAGERSGMEARLLADLERLQLHAPCESTDVHALHYWGLFSMLNQLVRATIHSFAHGRRACFRVPHLWSYQPARGCRESLLTNQSSAFSCYFGSEFSCGRQCRRAPLEPFRGVVDEAKGIRRSEHGWPQAGEIEYVVGGEMRILAARYTGLDFHAIRSAVTRWAFRLSPRVEDHLQSLRHANHLTPHGYVAVHLRLSDKLLLASERARKVPLSAFVAAAAELATTRATPIMLFTISAAEVIADLNHIPDTPTLNLSRFRVPVHLANTAERTSWIVKSTDVHANAFNALADMKLLSEAAGAVVTFSSNMGRFLHYLTLSEQREGRMRVRSMDWASFAPEEVT